jgi:hypothetical protein
MRRIGDESPGPVPAVPSIPQKGFHRSASVPESVRSVPLAPADAGQLVLVDGEPGWWLPGTMPKGNGPTLRVLVVDPNGCSRQVERRRIAAAPSASAV